MKKIILFVIFVFVLNVFVNVSFAASNEEKIYISDFVFTDEDGNENKISSDSFVYARCNIQRIDDNADISVPYELVMQIRRNGRLISLTSSKGEINIADGKVPAEVKGHINGDSSGCEITAYFVENTETLIPLANCAAYNSSSAVLDKITVNNKLITGFDPDVFEYIYRFDSYPQNIPVLRIFPSDYSSVIQTSGEFPKPLCYKISSSDNSKENEYVVKFDITKTEKTLLCNEQKEKRRDADLSKFKSFPLDSETVYTTTVTSKLSSYINMTNINASNVNKFTTSGYLTFDLSGCDVALSEEITLTIRGKINRGTINRELNLSLYGYDPNNSNPKMESDDFGYLGEQIDSKNIYSDGIATANSDYFDYVFDISKYVAEKFESGETQMTFILTFEDDEIINCFNLLKSGEWPDGIAKDLNFGYVLNTAATRKYDGTSIIYGDGQPRIKYYEYVK